MAFPLKCGSHHHHRQHHYSGTSTWMARNSVSDCSNNFVAAAAVGKQDKWEHDENNKCGQGQANKTNLRNH